MGDDYCPIVNAGPRSVAGHSAPGARKVLPGYLLHLDFGIEQDQYCSDIQRMWYVPADDESGIPEELPVLGPPVGRRLTLARPSCGPVR